MNFNFDLLVLKFRLEDFPNAVLLPGIVVHCVYVIDEPAAAFLA